MDANGGGTEADKQYDDEQEARLRAPQRHDDDRGYAGGATRRLHASQERNARGDGTHAPMSGFVTTRPRFHCAGAWVERRVGEGRRRTPTRRCAESSRRSQMPLCGSVGRAVRGRAGGRRARFPDRASSRVEIGSCAAAASASSRVEIGSCAAAARSANDRLVGHAIIVFTLLPVFPALYEILPLYRHVPDEKSYRCSCDGRRIFGRRKTDQQKSGASVWSARAAEPAATLATLGGRKKATGVLRTDENGSTEKWRQRLLSKRGRARSYCSNFFDAGRKAQTFFSL